MSPPIPILLYHRVADGGAEYATSPALFDQHLDWLAERGYRTITGSEVADVVAGTRPAPERAVALTFDDGYADLATEIAPRLRQRGFTATAFLITNRCPDSAAPANRYLSWPEARSLATEGVFEFQSHTHTHTKWDVEPSATALVVDDVATARSILAARLGEPEATFTQLAWPYGRTCPDWEQAVAALGVTTQYGVQNGAVTRPERQLRLPRLLLDGAPVRALALRMTVVSHQLGAAATNSLFSILRPWRGGGGAPGYR